MDQFVWAIRMDSYLIILYKLFVFRSGVYQISNTSFVVQILRHGESRVGTRYYTGVNLHISVFWL